MTSATKEAGWLRRRPGSLHEWVIRLVDTLSLPAVIFFILSDDQIHPAYGMSWRRKFRLGWRLFRISRSVTNGTSYRAHLAMASKMLQIPPEQEGVVVECGCWMGGSTACLSVICDYADRQLIVYDSFDGLPAPDPRDELARMGTRGMFRGPLETVRENVRKYGVLERCTFRQGWFEETLPHHEEPIILAYLDVDLQKSLHECVINLWPHLIDTGYVFIDEYHHLRYCALFWSERWWRTYMDSEPPGLLGSGTGIGVGTFWVGPTDGAYGRSPWRRYQAPHSVGYTRRDFAGCWHFFPEA